MASASGGEFPAGLIQVGRHKVGVVKIGVFTPQGFPDLCASALAALRISRGTPCPDSCSDRIMDWAAERMTRDLASQLRSIRGAGAEILLVDVADNGGGTEWAEAAARMVTPIPLKSARMGFVRGPHWAKAFTKARGELLTAARGARGEDQALLMSLASQVGVRLREAQTACDSTPLWRGERRACRWLEKGFTPPVCWSLIPNDSRVNRGEVSSLHRVSSTSRQRFGAGP